MLWPTLCCALFCSTRLGGPDARPQPTVQAVPAGRADLGVWRRAMDARARGTWPFFVAADDAAAAAVLATLGVAVAPHTWTLAHLDAGSLATALLAGDGLHLRTAAGHRPLQVARSVRPGGPEAVPAGPMGAVSHATDAGAGAGVLLGLVDTGIDLHHPAFRDRHGRARVVALWDQDAVMPTGLAHPGPGHAVPAAFGYGHACYARAIAAGTCPFGDPLGHGTHVASIAAGSDARAPGLSPGADIAVVRSQDFTQLADAVAFLVDLADRRGEPLVINISVGGHYGPHDGQTPLEMYFNRLAGAGRSIVAAAGNDGDAPLHVQVPLGDAPARVGLQHLPSNTEAPVSIEFWSAADTTLAWQLELWRQGRLAAAVRLDAHGGTVAHALLADANGVVADVLYGGDWAAEHGLLRHGLAFSGDGVGTLAPGDTVALCMTGHGTLQGWVGQGHATDTPVRFATTQRPGWIAGDSQRSIAVPATAVGVITVGSYSLGPQAFGPAATVHAMHRAAPPGERSFFSSRGPTGFPAWTGLKPNLCAPGGPIVAARSRDVPDGPHTLDATQMLMQGTSMAAPHVSGTIARLLQNDPTLTPRDVRDILQHTARQDGFTGPVPNAAWGAGKLDATAAAAALATPSPSCQAHAAAPCVPLGPLGALCGLIWRARRRRRQHRGAQAHGRLGAPAAHSRRPHVFGNKVF